MGKMTDLNVTGLNSAKHAALLGDAHEMIVAGLLCRLGFEVGLIAAKGGAYDCGLSHSLIIVEPFGRFVFKLKLFLTEVVLNLPVEQEAVLTAYIYLQ